MMSLTGKSVHSKKTSDIEAGARLVLNYEFNIELMQK